MSGLLKYGETKANTLKLKIQLKSALCNSNRVKSKKDLVVNGRKCHVCPKMPRLRVVLACAVLIPRGGHFNEFGVYTWWFNYESYNILNDGAQKIGLQDFIP